MSWIQELAAVDAGQVSTDAADLAAHGCDAWPVAIKRQLQGKTELSPEAVVYPRSAEQVASTLRWANDKGVPITPWGGGSAVTGAPLPLTGGISLDLLALNEILSIDEQNLTVTVQSGVMGGVLEDHLNALGYSLRHVPQSLAVSTVGGWVSTMATGQFSSRYGGIEHLVVSLQAVLPSGEIVNTMHVPRAALGPDLKRLFIGAEGTLGVVTEVTLKIFPHDVHQILEAVRFDAVEPGLDVMRLIMRRGLRPFLVRYYDQEEARHAMVDPEFTGCAMFLGFEGVETVAHAEYAEAMKICRAAGGRPVGPEPVLGWLERRFDFSAVENIVNSPSGVAETIEVANFWSGIHDTYIQLKTALAPYADEVLGHFSHVYEQGTSLYIILLRKPEEGKDAAGAERMLSEIWDIANRIALDTGAAVAHHHGAGLARLPVIREALGSSMTLLEALKQALDPEATLCPGKLGLGQG
jgi:alkyldihydroxyacetonephosphate synthase